MNYFIDIKILRSGDLPQNLVLSVVFEKLHNSLVEIDSRQIGISFPEHKTNSLGDLLRLHGSKEYLKRVMETSWLVGLDDYVQVHPIHDIPADCKHRIVRRVQSKSNPDRLRRRAMRRHSLEYSEAVERIPDSAEKLLSLPYLHLRSRSTKQLFPIFVDHGAILEGEIRGTFSTYGFSTTATVPWF